MHFIDNDLHETIIVDNAQFGTDTHPLLLSRKTGDLHLC